MGLKGSDIEKNGTEPDIVSLHALRLGFCTVHFGVLKDQSADDVKSKTLVCKISGPEPKQSGERVSVFTIGLKMIRYADRMKVGFIKRRQILERA